MGSSYINAVLFFQVGLYFMQHSSMSIGRVASGKCCRQEVLIEMLFPLFFFCGQVYIKKVLYISKNPNAHTLQRGLENENVSSVVIAR